MKKLAVCFVVSLSFFIGGCHRGPSINGRYKVIYAVPRTSMDAVAEFSGNDTYTFELRLKGATGKLNGKYKVKDDNLSTTMDFKGVKVSGVPKGALPAFKKLLAAVNLPRQGKIEWRGNDEFVWRTKEGMSTFTRMRDGEF